MCSTCDSSFFDAINNYICTAESMQIPLVEETCTEKKIGVKGFDATKRTQKLVIHFPCISPGTRGPVATHDHCVLNETDGAEDVNTESMDLEIYVHPAKDGLELGLGVMPDEDLDDSAAEHADRTMPLRSNPKQRRFFL